MRGQVSHNFSPGVYGYITEYTYHQLLSQTSFFANFYNNSCTESDQYMVQPQCGFGESRQACHSLLFYSDELKIIEYFDPSN